MEELKIIKDKSSNASEKLDKEKIHFAKNKTEWLGFEINQHGIKPLVAKTEDIQNLNAPHTCKQLKSFLGSVHHLTKFVPNLATQCRIFQELLKKDVKYILTTKHQTAFEKKST